MLITFLISINLFSNSTLAQTYNPIMVTGFNHDVVAETGTSSLTTTTVAMDGVTVSNKVMYTNAFRITNGFGGGGLPDNGTITSAVGTYQMAAFPGNNALLLQRTQTGDLNLTTPSRYSTIRILCLSTEGTSTVKITLGYSDGSSTVAFTNYSVPDWFNNTANLVLSGFGRVTRATPATGADAYPTNPRMYYITVNMNCADRQKTLTKVSFENNTTGGSNAPYPNAIFFGISGAADTQAATVAITNATCANNGSATLTLTGYTAPYTISWNTTPTQSGITASNLTPGSYQATITDGTGCSIVVPAVITLTNNLALSVHADTTICSGSSFNANTSGNASSYSWSPTTGVSNPAIANPVLSPTVQTVYTVTATTGSCTLSRSFTVNVQPAVTLSVHADTSICNGASFAANTVSNASTFTWTPASGLSSTSSANPNISPSSSVTYTVVASAGNCRNTKSFTVSVLPSPTVNAGQGATIFEGVTYQLNATGSGGTYSWSPATGLSATNILNPVAHPLVTTTYTLTITNSQGCTAGSTVTVTVIPYCINPMNAFTPNGDGQYDRWFITDGNCLKSAQVQVYNRYGGKVYESGDYKNDWDGTYKGKPVPDGTYYYVIKYLLINNTSVIKRGDLTIIR